MGIRSRGDVIPAGAEMPYHGGTLPAGWLLMFGQVLNIADYPRLFAAIGAVHGGDGVTTFGIPDSRGRVTAGKDNMGGSAANRLTSGASGVNGATLGAVGGGETFTLALAETPVNNTAVRGFSTAGASDATRLSRANDGGGTSTNAIGGSGNAHRTVQPTLIANKMIKT